MTYEQDYFAYQRRIGEFGGIANRFKFDPFITPEDVVLDFGCGGGYLLKNLQVKDKAGLEISEIARQTAQEQGLQVYASIDEIPDSFATVIISNHVLEHVEAPLDTLRALRPKLKPGGKAVFVVPHEKPDQAYKPGDVNQHLYTWNPMTLGNLFAAAGYMNVEVDVLRHMWPPKYHKVYKVFGADTFHKVARIYARLRRGYQIRAIAYRGE